MKHLLHNLRKVLRTLMLLTAVSVANYANAQVSFSGDGTTETPTTLWSDKAADATSGQDYTVSQETLEIHTELGLAWLAKTVNEKKLTATKVLLTKDLDLSGHLWTPIGYSGSVPFVAGEETGVLFDGQNHVIQNMICTGAEDSNGFVSGGLFGWAAFGTLQNIIIEKASVTAISKGFGYAGGLVGVAFNENVINCHVIDSKVTGERVPAQSTSAGGMASASVGGIFTNCTVKGTSIKTSCYGGGFVGYVEDEGQASDFLKCATVGCTILANSSNLQIQTLSGAFIGEVSSSQIKAKNCYTHGCEVIKSEESKGKAAMGLFYGNLWGGTSKITAENCFADGIVTNADLNKGPFGEKDNLSLTNCYYNEDRITYENGINGLTGIKAADFADGKFAYQLNASSSGIWGQIVGTDQCPDFLTENNKVNKIAYTGDYTATVYCNGSTVLPQCSETGYVYTFTVGQTPFLGTNITQDVNVTVKKEVGFSGGDGTVESPYLIETEAQLKKIADNLSAHYKLTNSIMLTAAWTSIGGLNSLFKGTLDGSGHKISGLTTSDGEYAGLFAINAGTIKNLGVEIAEGGITGQYVGGIAGQNYEVGTITNCYTSGAFASTKSTFAFVGGITGKNRGTVTYCYTTIKEIRIIGTSSYNYYAGGIVGDNTNESSAGTVQHCLVLSEKLDPSQAGGMRYINIIAGASVDLSGNVNNNTNFYCYRVEIVGGFLNYSTGAIGMRGIVWNGSFAEGNTSWAFDDQSTNFYLKTTDGEVMGQTFAVTDYRYMEGEGTSEDPYKISSLDDLKKMVVRTVQNRSDEAGKYYKLQENVEINEEIGQISPFFNTSFRGVFDGNGKTITMSKLSSNANKYGLFGEIGEKCVIKNLHVDCSIELNLSDLTGNSPDIGTIAYNASGSQNMEKENYPHIENCYVTGSIKATAAPKATGVGGILSHCAYGVIQDCYTDLDIELEIGTGGSGMTYAGGIAAVITSSGQIHNCYAKGTISAECKDAAPLNTGGIVGSYDGPSPKNCLALNPSIFAKSLKKKKDIYNARIAVKAYWQEFEKTNNNYASAGMILYKNDEVHTPIPDAEEAGGSGQHMEEDGADWQGTAITDQWEVTADGYVNLKSIREVFGLDKQIKVADYVPFNITLDESITNGTVSVDPKEAFAGDTIKLTITPSAGYRLSSVKATGAVTDTVTIDMTDSTFIMPAQAVTVSAGFILDSLRLADIPECDSLLIFQKDKDYYFQIKKIAAPETKALPLDTDIPFNGILTGKLAEASVLSFEPTCQIALVFDEVEAKSMTVKEGASLVLESGSQLTYTEIDNQGGTLVAREGAVVDNTATGEVKMNELTITTPVNGKLMVKAGSVAINSGDRIAENTAFTVTATPNSGYKTEKLTVQAATGALSPDVDGLYTMPNAVVTVSATFKSTYVPPVIPDPVYYTVTIPQVEGATTNPAAGNHQVEEGDSFSFSLTLEAGYDQSEPVVTANGVTLTRRASDGKYLILNISDDQEISITGIVENTPTANDKIDNGTKVWAVENTLFVRLDQPCEVVVLTPSGRIARKVKLAAGENRINDLNAGLYIVNIENKQSVKVIIR